MTGTTTFKLSPGPDPFGGGTSSEVGGGIVCSFGIVDRDSDVEDSDVRGDASVGAGVVEVGGTGVGVVA